MSELTQMGELIDSLGRGASQSRRFTGTMVNDGLVCVRALRESKVVDKWQRLLHLFPGVTNILHVLGQVYCDPIRILYGRVQQLGVPLSRVKQLREAQCSRVELPESESLTVRFISSSNPTMRLSSSNSVLTGEVLLRQQTLQWALTCSALQ